jgi:hypothetical protein
MGAEDDHGQQHPPKSKANRRKPKRARDPATIPLRLEVEFQRLRLGPPGDPSRHVSELLHRIRESGRDILDMLLNDLRKHLSPEEQQQIPSRDSALKDPQWFVVFAEAAVHLDHAHPPDQAIEAAFDAAGLSYRNPLDWRLLMQCFCWAHFGPRGEAGAHRVWTNERYAELLHDVERLKVEARAAHRRLFDIDACKELRTRHKKKYGKMTLARLRRTLSEARHPDYNGRLRTLLFTKALAYQETSPLKSEKERGALLKRLRKECCVEIACNWRPRDT